MSKVCSFCEGEGVVEFDLGYAGSCVATEPMIDIRPCPKCNGRGQAEPPTCRRCDGTGEIWTSEYSGGARYPVLAGCPDCLGTGVAQSDAELVEV